MLYDPKWERQARADPYTIGSLIEWLEKQPAEEKYWYVSNGNCLLARYLKASGHTGVEVSGWSWKTDQMPKTTIPSTLHEAAIPDSWSLRSTFGAALERARALNK